MQKISHDNVKVALQEALDMSCEESAGLVADYIPELANVDKDYVSAAVILSDSTKFCVSNKEWQRKFTLQSVSKLVTLIGLLEEFGSDQVFSWIRTEPSGQSFSSISYLELYGPRPANPLINSGAICLSSHIPGNKKQQQQWLESWMFKLFGAKLSFNKDVYKSEIKTADRNRALAYLMKSTGVLEHDVEETLDIYIRCCAYEVDILQAAYLPMLLANGGLDLNGNRIFSEKTSNQVMAIMATCGLYDESGTYLARTGLPAKTGVSGLMIAVATGKSGIAAMSPRLNIKGGSIRGHIIIKHLSKVLGWHFAAPWGENLISHCLHPPLPKE